MTEFIRKKLNDSKKARWTVLGVVAFTMFCGYFISDVMAPLMDLLSEEYSWTAKEYGIFTGAYSAFNVLLFMLIFSGMILDKIGPRITGIGACLLMIIGCGLKYYAVASPEAFTGTVLGIKSQVAAASLGFAIFGVGIETAGITVTKVIARWFKGYEVALAMGIQVSVARLGTGLAYGVTLPLANYMGNPSSPILIGLLALCIGLLSYLVFCVMDRKLDRSLDTNDQEIEEPFKVKDILLIISKKGFWLLALLCVLFYSAVFPFLKFSVSLMVNKYGIDPNLAGLVPMILPFGTVILTPLFGGIYDKKGKGATIMISGAMLLILVHFLFSLPILNVGGFAAFLMVLLGIAFSLVPSAMWPSVPKIIPQNLLGTAYGLIFWVQNIGLGGVPMLIGWVLSEYCITGETEKGGFTYNYTLPMVIFMCFGILALFVAFLLKKEDRKKGYGLEKPNIQKAEL